MVKKTPTPKKLQDQIVKLENDYRRVLADYQNQERRNKENQANFIRFASASLIEKILLHLDSLELAQSHLHDQGLSIVIKDFFETLKSEGLTPINTENADFDPLTMDCVDTVKGPKDKVVKTLSKGYYLYEKVLRPAKVSVGDGSEITSDIN